MQKKGLSAIALTNHDTISGLDEGRKYSEMLGIRFIYGVEINSCSTVNNKKINMHILEYLFNANEIKDK